MNESKFINENNNSTLSALQALPGLTILPSDFYGNNIDDKIQMLAVTFNDLYLRTKEELHGLFTLNEAIGITQAFCGTMFTEFNKQFLLMEIEESVAFDGIDKLFGFDDAALMVKLKGLTEFQSLTVIGMVDEFRIASNGNMIPDKVVKKLFMIE